MFLKYKYDNKLVFLPSLKKRDHANLSAYEINYHTCWMKYNNMQLFKSI